MNKVAVEILGYIGVFSVLVAYFLVSTGRLQSFSARYQILNLVGALILSIYAVFLAAWASAILNGIWSLIALFALIRIRTKAEATANSTTQ